MFVLNRALYALVGLAVLVSVLGGCTALYYRGKANTLEVKYNAAQVEVQGLQSALQESNRVLQQKTKTDVKQSAVRASSSKKVRAVQQEVHDAAIKDNPVMLGDAAVLRLRRLVEAGNSEISAAHSE